MNSIPKLATQLSMKILVIIVIVVLSVGIALVSFNYLSVITTMYLFSSLVLGKVLSILTATR